MKKTAVRPYILKEKMIVVPPAGRNPDYKHKRSGRMDIITRTAKDTDETIKDLKSIITRLEKIGDYMQFISMEYDDLINENNELLEAIRREFSKEDVKRILDAAEKIQQEKDEKELKKEGITPMEFDKLLSVLSESGDGGADPGGEAAPEQLAFG